MAQVGRISGPLLYANLERNGIDLAFRNDLNTTQLLYLDVNNGLIGVNTAAPSWQLDINGTTQTTNLIASTSLDLPGYTLSTNTIRVKTGDIYLNAGEAIVMANMETDQIHISDNIISTIDSNADIDITPNGTGTVRMGNGFDLNTYGDSTLDLNPDLKVFGNIHTPGNITFEGNITFGDTTGNDTVNFNADLTTDLIPDQNDTYALGSPQNQWDTFYTNFINGRAVSAAAVTAGLININKRIGGIVYVAQEGNDSNVGDHPLGAVATIKEALSRAEASSDQPFTIFIASGEYQEELPLVVPPNTSVVGQDIRNTVILPDTNSQSEDVFHLHDKTVVSNLTIKNFYYNVSNNTGYAFRFAPNAVMNERSPYVQNVTVLTQPTTPGGTDAGRGAWVDGSELNSTTTNATLLFHSCTFISPGADVINMTNGARVEWLNSFTYYANRGLYAFNGATGRISEDGSTTIYGAELRSIGSANVYGNYGVVADGADTLMYLIQHNFAYIGAGTDNSNDLDTVIQANEVVELNSGQIHYVSTDQVGNFRVGDNFFVNLETGDTSISIDTAEIDTLTGMIINSPGGTTTIDGGYIRTGAIRLFGNSIVSVVGDLNLEGATNTVNFNDNVNMSGNLEIRDNFSFGGNLNIAGNEPGRFTNNDRLTFNVQFEQDFNPHQHQVHDLGEAIRPWYNAYLDRAEISDIIVDENYITTNVSNADLELRANGTGEIIVPTNDVQIDNNLTVSGITDLQNTTITGTFIHTGDYNQTGNYTIAGTLSNSNIQIAGNVIETTLSNSDLELRANGIGEIYISSAGIQIDNDLTVAGSTNFNNLNINGTLFLTGDTSAVRRTEEYSRIYDGNSGLPATQDNEFKINSAQDKLAIGFSILDPINYQIGDYIAVSNSDAKSNFAVVQIDSVDNTTATNIIFNISLYSGTLTFVQGQMYNLFISETANYGDDFDISGNLTALQGLDVSGEAQFEEIYINNNYITTTTSNADLELRASGVGSILFPTSNLHVKNNLTVDNIINNNDTVLGSRLTFDIADINDIDITQNYITTEVSNADLELRASGTGVISIESDAYFSNNLIVGNNTFLQDATTNYEYGPELVINGTFDTNLIGWAQTGGGSATATNGNLRINATGAARNVSQEIIVEPGKTYDFEVQFRSVSNANAFYLRIFESGVGTLYEWNESSGLVADQLLTGSIVPQGTAIDIIFRAVNTIVEWDNVSFFEDIGFVTTYEDVEVDITGSLDITGSTTQTGNYTQTGNSVIDGTLTVTNEFTKSNINIDANIIKNTGEGLRLSAEASAPGSLPYMVNAIIGGATDVDFVDQADKNLVNFLVDNNYIDVNGSGTLTTTDYIEYLRYITNGTTNTPENDIFIKAVTDEMIALEYATPGYFNSIIFDGNYFQPDLELRANGTGIVSIPNNDVRVLNNLYAAEITSGSININQDLELNEIIITDSLIEIDDNFVATTASNSDLELRAEGNLLLIPSANTTLEQNLNVDGNVGIKGLTINGNLLHTGNRNQQGNLLVIGNVTVSSTNIESEIQFDDIVFNDNYIETTRSNADLDLRANGAGIISIPDNNVYVNNDVSLGTLNTTDIAISSSISAEEFELSSNIKIFDNVITTTNSNSNLELKTTNNNDIVIEDLIFNNNELRTQSSNIRINVNNSLAITATGALLIPKGTTAERQVLDNSIRFNTTDNVFEGFNNNRAISFNGVYSSNRQTSMLADPTNNVINFNITGLNVGSIDSSGLTIHGLDVDDISIQNSTIRTDTSNSDLELRANGNGQLVIDDITISEGTIQNNSNGSLLISNTLYGRTRFTGTAVKIPAGTTLERPSTPEVGTARWNTTEEVLEVWDGSTFVTAAGTSATISQAEMDDLILEYTLIFG